jgi:hypothetical protein
VSWRRAQLVGALALVLAPLAFLFLRCTTSPEVAFVRQSRDAPWLEAPRPVTPSLQQWGRLDIPVDTFRGRFDLEAVDGPVHLRLRALRRFRVRVNGSPVTDAASDGRHWREETRLDVTPWLQPGLNDVAVEVENATGPPLLSLRIEGLAEPLRADSSWWVESGGRPLGFARVADDTLPFTTPRTGPPPAEALARHGDTALLLFTFGLLGFLAGERWLGPRGRAALPALALGLASVCWVGLFARTWLRIPLTVGFDARHHLAYVAFLREHGSLPLATDGWSMYHPPLFYAASALLASLGEAVSGVAMPAPWLKLLPFLSGLGSVGIAFALARRLFPDDLRVPCLAVIFAAILPMNLYASAYFSNESPHALMVGLALLGTVGALLEPRITPRRAAVLGLLFGLAALTKFTAIALVPIALLFLGCKLFAVEGASPARTGRALAVFAISLLCVAGWFYARNWIELGRPLVGNWSLPGPGRSWWQQPGFHTLAYYTDFGASLRQPLHAGFQSFWDGIYATLWGDGGIAGRILPAQRHGFWNYDFMAMGYLLALPATALLLFGALRCVWLGFRDPDPRRRAALGFVATAAWAIGISILYMTVQLPYFAQAKAFYGLSMIAPLALFFAMGVTRLDTALAGPRGLPARAVLYGWLFLFAAVLLRSYAG